MTRKPIAPPKPSIPTRELTAIDLAEIARINPTGRGEHPIIQALLAQRAAA
jgi:hypothetical protein